MKMPRYSIKNTVGVYIYLLLLNYFTHALKGADSGSNDYQYDCVQVFPNPILDLGGINLQLTPPPSSRDDDTITEFIDGLTYRINQHMHVEDSFPCFRTLEFDSVIDIKSSFWEQSEGVFYRSATLEIFRMRVGFNSHPAKASDLRKEIQTFVNNLHLTSRRKDTDDNGFSVQAKTLIKTESENKEWPPFPIKSLSLTWSEENYTLAPTTSLTSDVIVCSRVRGLCDEDNNKLRNPLIVCSVFFVLVLVGYFLSKRRTAQIENIHHSKERDEGAFPVFSPMDREKYYTGRVEKAAFPFFSREDHEQIKVNDVQKSKLTSSPKDLEEICILSNSNKSVVSSLGKSESNVEFNMSIGDPFAVPMLNFGQNLRDRLVDEDWVGGISRLMTGKVTDDLLIHSSENSQDMKGFATDDFNPCGDTEV